MRDNAGALIAAASLLLNLAMAVGGVFLKLTLAQMEISLRKAIAESRAETDLRIENEGRMVGEVAAALRAKVAEIDSDLRAKITGVELWSRDNFVRRDSFQKVTDDVAGSIRDLSERLDKRLERMEGKIDSAAKGSAK